MWILLVAYFLVSLMVAVVHAGVIRGRLEKAGHLKDWGYEIVAAFFGCLLVLPVYFAGRGCFVVYSKAAKYEIKRLEKEKQPKGADFKDVGLRAAGKE